MKVRGTAIPALAGLVLSSVANAQPAPPPGGIPPAILAQMQREEAAYRALPDTPGTGAYPAMKEEIASLPNHTVYRPADLAKLGTAKLPVIAWGNGGCAGDGAAQRLHLLELASHGYLVIANGGIKSGPGAAPQPPRPAPPMPGPGGAFTPPPPETQASQLTEAIDWAIAENARPGSPLQGRIDPAAVAVSGWSCGGVQALTISVSDPRVKTTVIHNSGLFPDGQSRMPGMDLPKASLGKLHAPIIYILGGPTDIAYTNGTDDFRQISQVPIALVSMDVGHTGTFMKPNGGKAAQVAIAWLDWRLKGDAAGAAWFTGTGCKLCTDPDWKLQKKGF